MSSNETLPQDENQATAETPATDSTTPDAAGNNTGSPTPPATSAETQTGDATPAAGAAGGTSVTQTTTDADAAAAEIAAQVSAQSVVQSAGEVLASAETVVEGSQDADAAAEKAAAAAMPPRPRLQVGVAGVDVAKAVPSLGDNPTPAIHVSTHDVSSPAPLMTQADTETSVEQAADAANVEAMAAGAENPDAGKSDVSAEIVPSKAPVSIPRADDLDPEVAASIDNLMAAGVAPPAVVAPAAEATTAEAGTPAEGTPAATRPGGPTNLTQPGETQPNEEELTRGQRLQARVQTISGDDVFLDLGYRSPGVVSVRQFDKGKEVNPGLLIEVSFDKYDAEEGLIHVNLPRGRRKVSGGNWDAVEAGQIVDCMVTKSNKGGLEISVASLRGFLPASQVDLHYVSDLEPFIGQKITCKITEVNPTKRNLIVSRRAFLLEERKELEAEAWTKLAVGQNHEGTVKTLKDYGAFVDLGGVDGFLHIGEMAWTRLRHPRDLLKEGQQIDVQILTLDPERKRIGLGMKQLRQNPWDNAADKYAVGSTVGGKVTRTTDFGAFVELEFGVEGLVHISELDYRRVGRVTDVLKEGQAADFKVLEVDPQRQRISLSLKALKEKPPELVAKETPDEDKAPGGGEEYKRKRQGPLKGGYSGTGAAAKKPRPAAGGGGLFGNPDDFTGK